MSKISNFKRLHAGTSQRELFFGNTRQGPQTWLLSHHNYHLGKLRLDSHENPQQTLKWRLGRDKGSKNLTPCALGNSFLTPEMVTQGSRLAAGIQVTSVAAQHFHLLKFWPQGRACLPVCTWTSLLPNTGHTTLPTRNLRTVKHYWKVVLDTTLALEALFFFCLFEETNTRNGQNKHMDVLLGKQWDKQKVIFEMIE